MKRIIIIIITLVLMCSNTLFAKIKGKMESSAIQANPNNQDNLAIIIKAVESGDHKMTKLMLQVGVTPNVADKHGTTLLMAAAYLGHVDILILLLENGANPDIRDDGGNTVIAYALENKKNRKRIFEILSKYTDKVKIITGNENE
jgi:ankyrin repeat protein